MQINEVKRENPNKKSQLVGRGGKRGKTSGRGGKGQTARAGNKRRPQIRDIIKKLPKLRGYRFSPISEKLTEVNLEKLNIFIDGTVVNPKVLVDKNIIEKMGSKIPNVKILGNGDLKVKLIIENCKVSNGAKKKIEKVGGIIK